MVWAALLTGALAGAIAFGWWRTDALLVPAGVYLACMAWFLRKSRA